MSLRLFFRAWQVITKKLYDKVLSQCSTVVRNTIVRAVQKCVGKPRFWTPVAPYPPMRSTKNLDAGLRRGWHQAYKKWGEISCSNVFFNLLFVICCAALDNTFLGVPFLCQMTYSGGDWLPRGCQLQGQKISPPKPPKRIFRPLSDVKNALWGLFAYLLAICMMKNCFKDVTELLIDLRLFYLKNITVMLNHW